MSLKIVMIFAAITLVHCKSVIVGQVYEGAGIMRVFQQTYEATGIPLLKREQEVDIEYPTRDRKIKGIAIKDLENGLAEASIQRGGIGFESVRMKLKSERGSGYKFLVEMYA